MPFAFPSESAFAFAGIRNPLQLKIHSATWGNQASRNDVCEALTAKPRNALMFFVNQEAFPLPDPAWGDDNKYVEVVYS